MAQLQQQQQGSDFDSSTRWLPPDGCRASVSTASMRLKRPMTLSKSGLSSGLCINQSKTQLVNKDTMKWSAADDKLQAEIRYMRFLCRQPARTCAQQLFMSSRYAEIPPKVPPGVTPMSAGMSGRRCSTVTIACTYGQMERFKCRFSRHILMPSLTTRLASRRRRPAGHDALESLLHALDSRAACPKQCSLLRRIDAKTNSHTCQVFCWCHGTSQVSSSHMMTPNEYTSAATV